MVSSIVFLGTQLTVGGAQRLLLVQAAWFHERGYQVTAAFFYDKDHLRTEWASNYPFDLVDFDAWRPESHTFRNGFRLIVGLIRLYRFLRQKKVDVLETFTPDSNILGLFVGRLAGVPIRIASHHGYIEGAGEWRKRLHGWMVNHGFCHRLVAVSERVKRMSIQEEGVIPEKILVILNGIEKVEIPEAEALLKQRENLGIREEDFVYLTVSRLTVQKGHTYLLDAIPMVLERYPQHTVFLLAGDGHQRQILERKAAQLGLDQQVRFLGVCDDIPALLSLANVFVLPSLWEGLPLALLEAMSVGLAVVATRVEGVDGVITHGENGFLVPPMDSYSLASALIRIRDLEEARLSFGKRNAALVQQSFTTDRMCAQYQDLFLQVYPQGSKR